MFAQFSHFITPLRVVTILAHARCIIVLIDMLALGNDFPVLDLLFDTYYIGLSGIFSWTLGCSRSCNQRCNLALWLAWGILNFGCHRCTLYSLSLLSHLFLHSLPLRLLWFYLFRLFILSCCCFSGRGRQFYGYLDLRRWRGKL